MLFLEERVLKVGDRVKAFRLGLGTVVEIDSEGDPRVKYDSGRTRKEYTHNVTFVDDSSSKVCEFNFCRFHR